MRRLYVCRRVAMHVSWCCAAGLFDCHAAALEATRGQATLTLPSKCMHAACPACTSSVFSGCSSCCCFGDVSCTHLSGQPSRHRSPLPPARLPDCTPAVDQTYALRCLLGQVSAAQDAGAACCQHRCCCRSCCLCWPQLQDHTRA